LKVFFSLRQEEKEEWEQKKKNFPAIFFFFFFFDFSSSSSSSSSSFYLSVEISPLLLLLESEESFNCLSFAHTHRMSKSLSLLGAAYDSDEEENGEADTQQGIKPSASLLVGYDDGEENLQEDIEGESGSPRDLAAAPVSPQVRLCLSSSSSPHEISLMSLFCSLMRLRVTC